MSASSADYIVVGGGLTGCAIASCLSRSEKKPKVILIEAGPDPTGKANTDTILNGLALLGGELDHAYQSEPVQTTSDRVHILPSGKTLGGGSLLNFGGWLRADAADYDQWGETVGDKRWTYAGLKPYLDKVEARFGAAPISSDPERRYPHRGAVESAWRELGVKDSESSKGSMSGLTELKENGKNGLRQPSHHVYKLEDVNVLTDTLVHRVVFEQNKATGVLLADGREIKAEKEIILAGGAYRTPQLLMLSGIGDPDTLARHNIPLIHSSPAVGKNLHDHFAAYLAFRLNEANAGQALGGAKWTNPALYKGFPYDWVVSESLPKELLDKIPSASPGADKRNLFEILTAYAPPGLPGIPVDGNHIATSTMLLLPTSRGEVKIRSASPSDPPEIHPNYLSTEFDRETLKYATRRTLSAILGTEAMKKIIQSEVPSSGPGLEGLTPLTTESSDEEILHRIERTGAQHHHSGGTAAMGTVVDTEGRVIGVEGLRVADASIVALPLGGHPQATLYAMAEQIASFIVEKM